MKRITPWLLCLSLLLNFSALASVDSKGAAYQGGTTKEQDFPGSKDAVEGKLLMDDARELRFAYKLKGKEQSYNIPYKQIIDIEYGQKAGRRVGAAIATAILISPVGLFLLFSKKRNHYVTIGYRGTDGEDQVAIFELGKDIVRTTLPILEKRSGRKIEYQDDEGRNFNKAADEPRNQRAEVAEPARAKPASATVAQTATSPVAKPKPSPTPQSKKAAKAKEWWEMN